MARAEALEALGVSDIESFVQNIWESQHLLFPSKHRDKFRSVLTIDQVDEYLSRCDLRYPALRMVRHGAEIEKGDYCYSKIYGGVFYNDFIDVDKAYALFEGGASFCIQFADSGIRSLGRFCDTLSRQFGCRVDTNLFLTPAGSQGFTEHYDVGSFFAVQIFGQKTWDVFTTPVEDRPSYDQQFDGTVPDFESGNTKSYTLSAGDVLYVPRGMYHRAHTNDQDSLHITFALYPPHILSVLKGALEQSNDRRLRDAIYLDESTDCTDGLGNINLNNAINDASERLRRNIVSSALQDNRGRLLDRHSNANIFKPRDVDMYIVGEDDGELIFYNKKIKVGAELARFIYDLICDRSVFEISDIPTIGDVSREDLISLLLQEGLVSRIP